MSALSWLTRLPGDFETTPEIEALVNQAALEARRDREVRNALYHLLAPRLERRARRVYRRLARCRVCDVDDVRQEAFLVFCELVESWPGERSFLGYVHTRLPWRLARRLDGIERGEARLDSTVAESGRLPDRYLDLGDALFLAEVESGLAPADRALLRLHIGYGLPLTAATRLLGMSLRTGQRRWARLVEGLRASWLGQAPAPLASAPRGRPRRGARPSRRASGR